MDALKSKGQMLDQINLEQIPRSGFDLSYSTKGSGKIGRIIPTRCMECLPSDSIKGSTQAALQFQPLAVPILANMRVRQETWYVPNHILLDNWDTFITKGQDLSDNSVLPSFSLQQVCAMFGAQISNYFKVWFGKMFVYSYEDRVKLLTSQIQTLSPMYLTKEYSCWLDINSIMQALPLIKSAFKSGLFAKYQIDDLYDYVDSVCDSFEQYLADIADSDSYVVRPYLPNSVGTYSGKVVPLFKLYRTDDVATPTGTSVDYPKDKLARDVMRVPKSRSGKNWSEMSYYEQMFWQPNTTGQYAMPIATDYLNRFMQFLYDLCAPVYGLGSNLDYLGYKVMSPVEFYYCVENMLKAQYLDAKFGGESAQAEENVGTYKDVYFGGSIYAGIVTSSASTYQQNVLPLRACYAIWYNNYRDQLLETAAPEPVTKSVISTDELLCLVSPRIRAWSKDSFNTALANTGTGNMVVPISQQLSGARKEYEFAAKSTESMLDLGMTQYTLADGSTIDMPTRYLSNNHKENTFTNQLKYEFSLDTLRRAGRTEKWIQKALIYGNLIQDALFTHWGVKIKNERIQLPEFVTSSSELVKIDTILNNTTTAESMAGDKAGFASAYDNGVSFDWYSPENGYLISFMTILPEQTYPAGMPRHLCKLRIFDYAFPEFAQIGMDAVYNDEIQSAVLEEQKEFGQGIFGYQGRYYDYKCKQDEEHGSLRDTDDMYTFGRTYNLFDTDSRPKLNYRFVHCHPSLDMFVMDDPSQDQFRYDIHHSVAASRALPVCGMSV